MEEPVTLFVSEMSITMYSCKKNCEYCEKTYDKYSKFLVVTCCEDPKRFCFGCEMGSWSVPCQKCREKGRSEENNIHICRTAKRRMYVSNNVNFFPMT